MESVLFYKIVDLGASVNSEWHLHCGLNTVTNLTDLATKTNNIY